MLKRGNTVGIVCCSNGKETGDTNIDEIRNAIKELGLNVKFSPFIYNTEACFAGSAKERAKALMDFYEDKDVNAICDISGGDVANMVLPYLDYDVIRENNKPLIGFSDLTTVINAIYTKTKNVNVLYQLLNVVWDKSKSQLNAMKKLVDEEDISAILANEYTFLQGHQLEGIVVGGNIRCLLKLSGTEYFPDLEDKVLLLEGLGGDVPQYATYLAQLFQMGAFDKVSGIILGTFTDMENNKRTPTVEEMLFRILEDMNKKNLPVVKNSQIGHTSTAKAIEIGKIIKISK